MTSRSGAITTPDGEADQLASLQARIQALEAEVLARDNLLAVAAHELRNPMHTILLLVRSALGSARRDQTQDAIVKLERIRHVVDTYVKRATLLLDSVRLEANSWATERTEIDLALLVREVCASYEPDAQFAGSALAVSAPGALRGSWDRLAMEQIVGNLVSNAIKYGEGRPIEVTLQARGTEAQLTVRDRGTGIPRNEQSRIFERFQQAIGAGQKRSGFGIGLWLVKSLVEAHGGYIALQSAPHEGSTFTVVLPGVAPRPEDRPNNDNKVSPATP